MRKKTVVIVEDKEAQRLALQLDLERRKFIVRSAGTAKEAREVINELGEEIDVMVLDMMLEDPAEINTTGADLGIEVQNQHSNWLPEFLIHSAFNFVNYYKLALQLGAAAYLSKAEALTSDVIRHVRVLALKRALRLERPEVAEKLRSISESTKNLSAAVREFCQHILADELETCLGSPYVLLLTDETGTQNFATNTKLPKGHEPIYTVLQAMAHGISNFSSPYEVSEQSLKHLPQPSTQSEVEIYERLPRSAFIPLANVKNFRLSLGLFEPLPGEVEYPEEEIGKLALVLAQYVRSTIVEHFLRILVHLDSQKRAMLKSTAHLCLFLGQDQQGVLEQGVEEGQFQPDSSSYRTLVTMADDLWQTGVILGNVANSDPKEEYSSLEMRELIESAGAELDERMFLGDLKFTVEGSCRVKARRDDMYVAVIRVMQWLAQRRIETSPEIEPEIRVYCRDDNKYSVVSFEDRSARLPKKLREQLFQPFSVSVIRPSEKSRGPGLYLPLFLAKMLVEEKYSGWLDDRSDEIEGDIGHRLVMRFDSFLKADQLDVADPTSKNARAFN